MKAFIRILIAVVLLGGVIALTWWAAGTSSPRPAPSLATKEPAPSIRPSPDNLPPLPGSPTPLPPGSDPSAPPGPLTPSGATGGMNPEVFAEKLHQLLINDSIGHDQAALSLLDMLPATNVEQQVELSQHAANLLSDEQYGRIRNLLLDPKVSQEVKEVWYSDMLNRDPQLNIPLLAEVAKQKENPFHQEAIDTLSIILNPEIAENQTMIDAEVQRYLKELKEQEQAAPPANPM
jgi:hypothetical protein